MRSTDWSCHARRLVSERIHAVIGSNTRRWLFPCKMAARLVRHEGAMRERLLRSLTGLIRNPFR